MSQYQIAVVVGSLRRESFNRRLASAVVKLAPSDFSFKQLEIGDLPLYNQDDDSPRTPAGFPAQALWPYVQPLDSRRAQERHRSRWPMLSWNFLPRSRP